jgi:ribosomal protein S18 acetylase RimI-like enzyme
MLHTVTFIKAGLQDVEKLQAISRITFMQTFSADNTAADMEVYLNASFSIQKLSAELSNPDSVFYFAQENDLIIGYLKVNTGAAQTEKKEAAAFEIERIYVDQAYLGKKVGQLLFDRAVEIAKQKSAIYMWLGVWEKNHRALAFYKKNGFVPFDKHIFKLGNDEQTDIMMKLELNY